MAKNRLPNNYKKNLKKIDYYAAISLILLLKKSLIKETYWLNINDYKIPFLVLVQQTNFIKAKKHVVYLETYLRPEDKYFSLENNQLFKEWTLSLKKINPNFKLEWIESFKIFREKFAQPRITTDYYKRIPKMETPIKNLFFASMCQIYPADRGVNFAIKLGREAAEKLTKERC